MILDDYLKNIPSNQIFYKDEYGVIILGDSNKILWDLPFHFANAIITDPPYLIEGNKKMNWDGGRDYIEDIDKNGFADNFNFNMIDTMNNNLINTNMMFFCSKSQIPEYLSWYKRHKVKNWQLLEWHKPDAIPIGAYYLLDTEFIFHMWDKMNAPKTPNETWFVHNIVRSEYSHPTVKPEKIVSALISKITEKGDIIIDPFGGTCTTGACAKMLGRYYICIEKLEKYAEMGKDRLSKTGANQIQIGLI